MTLGPTLVARIADDYRDRGYRVELDAQLPPEFGLPNHRADLIAFGPVENVVVEVKRRAYLATDLDVGPLAASIAQRPGWRFELVLEGDPAQLPSMDAVQEQDLGEAVAQLERAREIAAAGFEDAAMLTAFSAGEAIMRRLLERLGDVTPKGPALGLAKTLSSLGEIDEVELEAISSALRVRNAIAHGFVPVGQSVSDPLTGVLDLFGRLAERAMEPI
jgi:hypothetical protein